MKNTALLIIDVQNDYFPGGKMELPESDRAVGQIKAILEEFRQKNLPVITKLILMELNLPVVYIFTGSRLTNFKKHRK